MQYFIYINELTKFCCKKQLPDFVKYASQISQDVQQGDAFGKCLRDQMYQMVVRTSQTAYTAQHLAEVDASCFETSIQVGLGQKANHKDTILFEIAKEHQHGRLRFFEATILRFGFTPESMPGVRIERRCTTASRSSTFWSPWPP